ncbi:hypothetical protein [Atlantibacter hermannii]|uniref:hypothetical protein n=1 Tax=Atlantibacter hermannii TaxID=565 RepID=UPI0028AED0D0|nr:hypothetical protein [Atlantibacter hermannii]
MMERITLVVEFEDGMCPGFSKGMDVLGGKLAAVTFRDELQHKGNEISSVRRINISANSLYSYLSGGE